MVDVIIPAYNAHDTIIETLQSIACQDIVDLLNVIIVNDASNDNYQKEIDLFSKTMNVREIVLKKNSGPGVARQTGIDNTDSDYIVFIDSDDVFYEKNSISKLLNKIKEGDFDEVVSIFLSEKDDGSLEEKYNNIWLHGKIYKRKFLMENGIRFNESRANEDNGFNMLIYLLDSKIGYLDEITYIWKNNINSITRKDNRRYNYSGKFGYIYNMTWAVEQALKRNINDEKLKEMLYSIMLSIYFYYLKFYNQKGVEKMLEKSKKIKKIYDSYRINDIKTKNNIYVQECYYLLNEMEDLDLLSPEISFNEFLKKIEKI